MLTVVKKVLHTIVYYGILILQQIINLILFNLVLIKTKLLQKQSGCEWCRNFGVACGVVSQVIYM